MIASIQESLMEPKLKPLHRSGSKNIYCPFYGNCLDYAAKSHWESWDCSECPHKEKRQPIRTDLITDGFGAYCELPSGVYRHVGDRFNVV
jgi:hypothetical protein